jgi:hypothetical protein
MMNNDLMFDLTVKMVGGFFFFVIVIKSLVDAIYWQY